MDRRRFLVNSLGGLTVLSLAPLVSFADSKHPKALKKVSVDSTQSALTIGYGPRPTAKNHGLNRDQPELPSMLYLWSESNQEFRIPVPFLAHSIAQSPVAPELILLIPKWGRRAVEVDLLKQRIVRSFTARAEVRFFGHGYYSEDGKTVFLSETNHQDNKSYISLWQGGDPAKQIRFVETFGNRIHECIPSLDGRHIVACNSGIRTQANTGSIVWLDKETYQLKHKLPFEGDGPSHILETKDGYFIYGGGFSRNPGPSSVCGSVTPDKKNLPLQVPESQKKNFLGETLSLAANEKNKHALVTVTPADSVFIFDYTTGKFVHRIEVADVTGIHMSNDLGKFYVASRVDSRLLVYDSNSFTHIDTIYVSDAKGWASHLNKIKSVKI